MTDTDIPLLFIYIHGFNSKGDPNSRKVKELEKLGKTVTVDYDSFSSFELNRENLTDEILRITRSHKDHFATLVGTSLGGYWASVIGKTYGIPAVLVNPAVRPQQTLMKHIGVEYRNFKDGELKILTEDKPASYPDAPKAGMFLILLDRGDDVINPNKTQSWFTVNPVVTFKGGSHRFEHMKEALPEVGKFVNRVLMSI